MTFVVLLRRFELFIVKRCYRSAVQSRKLQNLDEFIFHIRIIQICIHETLWLSEETLLRGEDQDLLCVKGFSRVFVNLYSHRV